MTTPLEGLRLFCEFLKHRLYTENLELLQRMITEIHSASARSETLTMLVAVGYPTISILPVINHDPQALGHAQTLLRRIRRGQVPPIDQTALRNLYEILHDQIKLTNWHALMAMYTDFCTGQETKLHHFVQHGVAAIAMFPIAPFPVHTETKREDTAMEEPQVEVEVEVDIESSSSSSSSEDDVLTIIRRTVQEVEATLPWERLYDVAKMTYPFSARTYPILAASLKTFWQEHGQAVWERNFWYPSSIALEIPGTQCYTRKRRQQAAAETFIKTVILPIYSTLGPEFFIQLDQQPKRVQWWWFRAPLVDLRYMVSAVGVDQCVAYIRSQATKRVPKMPRGFTIRNRTYDTLVSASMWSRMRITDDVTTALEQLIMSKAQYHELASMDDSEDD